jgi:hypothetical protein
MRALAASRSWASPEKSDREDRDGGSGNEEEAEKGTGVQKLTWIGTGISARGIPARGLRRDNLRS